MLSTTGGMALLTLHILTLAHVIYTQVDQGGYQPRLVRVLLGPDGARSDRLQLDGIRQIALPLQRRCLGLLVLRVLSF